VVAGEGESIESSGMILEKAIMLKSALLGLSLSAFAIASPTIAQADTAVIAPAPVDPVRLKLAEQTVARLIPPGTYQKIMKDMIDSMAGGLVEQMMGIDAAIIADMAKNPGAGAAEGKTMGDIAAEKDPAFKERMDITMKVMFTEMGTLMSEMEPTVRTALSNIYARKYSAKELTDMNAFFATPSGAAFAGNFMATFTDKEMMQASFGMMPKMMEAMPAIMKKVEDATAHLPPLPKTETAWADAALPACSDDGDESDCTDADWAASAGAAADAAKAGDEEMEVQKKQRAAWSKADRKAVEKAEAAQDDLRKKHDKIDGEMNRAGFTVEAAIEKAMRNAGQWTDDEHHHDGPDEITG
jgi:hypothetical protein